LVDHYTDVGNVLAEFLADGRDAHIKTNTQQTMLTRSSRFTRALHSTIKYSGQQRYWSLRIDTSDTNYERRPEEISRETFPDTGLKLEVDHKQDKHEDTKQTQN
jgi:hypothetical protein